jgi:hypothetical protein
MQVDNSLMGSFGAGYRSFQEWCGSIIVWSIRQATRRHFIGGNWKPDFAFVGSKSLSLGATCGFGTASRKLTDTPAADAATRL